ncbi:MAG: hypothetical protein PVI90_10365 [Desulfobacteraceae bacterium]
MPNITDSKMYWAANRSKVYSDGIKNKKIVIIGASRAQLGIDPQVIENELKLKTVHLAIDGKYAFYVLKDLSEDSSFDGIVIASMTTPALSPEYFEDSKPWVDFYHNIYEKHIDYSSKFDSFLQVKIQRQFVIMSSALSLKRIIYSLFSPEPLYVHMQTNRYRPAYYHEKMTEEELYEHRKKRIQKVQENSTAPMKEEIFNKILIDKLKKYYNDLKKHNADLILLRMPTTDEHWNFDQSIYPKIKYWDQIVKRTGIPTIHFKDYDQLSNFDCPDTSHLDANDSPIFTKNLSNIIREKIDM